VLYLIQAIIKKLIFVKLEKLAVKYHAKQMLKFHHNHQLIAILTILDYLIQHI